MPPRDGDGTAGDDELVAQIIPLRRRAGPIAPAQSPDRRPREVLAPPLDPPAPTERSVWGQPMPELRRRPIPDSVWSPDTSAPSAPSYLGGPAARWAVMPAAVAAVAVVAVALVVGGLLLVQPRRAAQHTGSSTSHARVSASAAHAKSHSTASHRTSATGAARHRTQGRHTRRAAATHPAMGTTHTVLDSTPASTGAGPSADVQEASAPAPASSELATGAPAGVSTPQDTGGSSAAPTAHTAPKARSEGGGNSEFSFEH